MTNTETTVQPSADIPTLSQEKPRESRVQKKLKEWRKKNGRERESDESEPEEELEEGVTILHKLFARKVTLHPGNIVQKCGKRINLGEADALRVAEEAGIPVPHVHKVETTPDGKKSIHMDYVPGKTLEELWPGMSAEQRQDICQQLRQILQTMRSIPPPPDLVGACDGTGIRDTRLYFTYDAPNCHDEAGFNAYLLSSVFKDSPPAIHEAFAKALRTGHRIVFTHCDLAPRNIMVQDGKITGLLDWEDGGWYPEYWEYVKFFYRSGSGDRGWRSYANTIFPQTYPDELVSYIAIARWQSP
ncbi:hypothetical protein PT974_10698 [Cladobotryum mycophilum]|uniref:Aminoglycoside phosphotransferase domain-containing protein n=1 Tax=Cladobotryum mycophilum TaxID=491253 RepID=A0ABR0SAN4_9HYPO